MAAAVKPKCRWCPGAAANDDGVMCHVALAGSWGWFYIERRSFTLNRNVVRYKTRVSQKLRNRVWRFAMAIVGL